MHIGRLAFTLPSSLAGALLLVGLAQSGAVAQDGHSMVQHQSSMPENKERTSALVKLVRDATRQFQDPEAAKRAGYLPQFGCVTGSSEGVMGVHFVNGALVMDPTLNVSEPELLVYEPLPGNRLRLVAVDYLVFSGDWNAHNPGPPELMGQLFHLFEAPNRFGLPEFFTLHVWAWKDNPQGTFANWNPNVSCDAYNPQSE